MLKDGGIAVHIMEWEELKQKERSDSEELLMQSVCRLEPS